MLVKNKPILVYDGDCSFCKAWANRWQSLVENDVEFESYQKMAGHYPEIRKKEFESEVKIIFPSGKIVGGAEAIFVLLSLHGSRFLLWKWLYKYFPLFVPISEFVYKLVARNRKVASRITRLFLNDKY